MRRIFGNILIVMTAMMSAACVEDIAQIPDAGSTSAEKVQMTFSAVSDVDTKLTLADRTRILWEPGDGIIVNGDYFYSTLEKPSDYSEFVGETAPADEYYAVSTNFYPQWDGKEYIFYLTDQRAVKDNLPVFLSAAKCADPDLTLHFRNLLGYVKFTVPESSRNILNLEVSSKGGEPMNGLPSVIDFSGDRPVLVQKDVGPYGYSPQYVFLDFDSSNTPGDYYVALYPGTYSCGLRFTFRSEDGKVAIKEISQEIILESGTIKNIGVITDAWWKAYEDQLTLEREALETFYKATGGDNWVRNDNWCSDKPVGEWYGIETDMDGLVYSINLNGNNLSGSIPESIGNLKYLKDISLESNQLNGELPASIYELNDLEYLRLANNGFVGSLSESIDNLTRLAFLNLDCNGLTGNIPESICNLRNLRFVSIGMNKFSGKIPEQIGKLNELEVFQAYNNNLTGSLPESIGNLTNLQYCTIDGNALDGELPASIGNLTLLKEFSIVDNNLSGSLPESIGNMKSIETLLLRNNFFTGIVPPSIMELDFWTKNWHDVLTQRGDGFSSEGLVILAPKFSVTTIDGEPVDDSVYSENEYTILYHYFDWCHYVHDFTPKLVELYKGYKNKGVEIYAYSNEGSIEYHKNFALIHNTEWPYILLTEDFYNNRLWPSPGICVVDKEGYIVFNYCTDDYNDLDEFLLEKLGEPDPTDPSDTPKLYESTDYSRDGEVKQLQVATKGNGIDIVLMGDAFSDRLIADGTYDRIMQTAMEKIFEEEPYKSFRDHFNVYSVTAVSKNEIYSQFSETVFEGSFGGNTQVGGNITTVFSYVAKAVKEGMVDQALNIVMMNSKAYAGTCYMFDPSDGDWGNGASVSFFPIGSDDENLGRLIQHEALGHGFAKLLDEYAYYENGHIPDEAINYYRSMEPYGWGRNIDFTSDPAEVKWSHFLTDSRYAGEGLGVIEGACTFWTGAYRPTEDSIMRYNWGGFNAPSREAIYYRIHKLAYGPDWEYNYEKFVEYDAINRKSAPEDAGMQKRRMNYVEKSFEPTAPPVIIKGSWRDAVR